MSAESTAAAGDGDGHRDRLVAARGLTAVIKHRRTLDQFEQVQPLTPLATELLYGSCRFYASLAAWVQSCLQRPVRKKDQDVWSLLIVGAYQLVHTRIPDHAAISTTVAASQRLRQPWAKSLVNGCLRAMQRSGAPPEASQSELPEALRVHLQAAYGTRSIALSAALVCRAPMALRVNRQQQSTQSYAERLAAAGLSCRPSYTPETLILESAVPAASLPGFSTGAVSVQDAGAQLAVVAANQLLSQQPRGPRRILDACAAPGGKLFHLLEHLLDNDPAPHFTALDSSASRLAHLEAEARRLGHWQPEQLTLLLADARKRDWWDGDPFDLILLDAPCTGSGTLRRHPEIKLLRDFSHLDDDIAQQNALLGNLLPLLSPTGALLYATCSLLPAENDARVAYALRRQAESNVQPVRLDLPSGQATERGWQLLPTDPDTDGFYYAGLVNLK